MFHSICILHLLCSIFVVSVISATIQTNGILSNKNCLVNTNLGPIRGIQTNTFFDEQPFCSYLGIRYALAPTGERRFKSSVASGKWTNEISNNSTLKTYEAQKYGPICHQSREYKFNLTENEDCLFLNVYTPNRDACGTNSFPVIAWIYGGGFINGFSNDILYGPDFLIEKCVILVSMNYRHGPMGFLSLALPEYSGNMGLKDQQLALKWIHENIGAFGGNNKNITILGESSGGACIGYHTINNKSKEYFNQAFALSGTPISYFAQSDFNNHTELAIEIAEKNGASIHNESELIEFLKNVSVDDIYKYAANQNELERTITFPWAPIIENRNANDPFLTEDPLKIYQEENINKSTIFSYTSLEYLLFSSKEIEHCERIEDLNENFIFRLPFHNLNQTACKQELKPIFDQIKEFYFGDDIIDRTQIVAYVKLFSDVNFIYSVQKTMRLQAVNSAASVRSVLFNAFTPLNRIYDKPNMNVLETSDKSGHADYLGYFFYRKIFAKKYDKIKEKKEFDKPSQEAFRTITTMTELISSFAKTGDIGLLPSIDKNDLDKVHFFHVNQTGYGVIDINNNIESYEFWRLIEEQIDQVKLGVCNQ